MNDDYKLQRLLLRMIADTGYWADHDELITKARIHRATPRRFSVSKSRSPTTGSIRHQFKLLEEKRQIKRTVATPHIRYEITAKGHLVLKPWYKKVGAFMSKRADVILTSAITTIAVYLLTELVKRLTR